MGYIRTAQGLGFTLAEIGENLPALWSSDTPASAVAALLAEKVDMIDRKIGELTALKQALLDRVAQTCPLLAAGLPPKPEDRQYGR